jgi:hypothetical protein
MFIRSRRKEGWKNINYEMQYAVLAPQENVRFVVAEVVILSSKSETMDPSCKATE